MNTRHYIVIGVVITMCIMCVFTPLLSVVFSFLLLGMIPGTSYAIPAGVMLVLYPILFLIALGWLNSQSLLIGEKPVLAAEKPIKKTPVKKKSTARKTTKRRAVATKRRPRTAT